MVFRVYVEKKQGLDHEASSLCKEINTFLGIEALERVRVINRYDVENATEQLFSYAVQTVLSEPQLDNVSEEIDADGASVFAVEFLLIPSGFQTCWYFDGCYGNSSSQLVW